MKKIIYFFILVFLFGIGIGYIILNEIAKEDEFSKKNVVNPQNLLKTENTVSENTVTVESQEIKISPQAVLVMNKYYKECNHTITSVVEIPVDMVNLTEEKLQNEYPDWEIISFNSKEVSIYKEFDGVCGQHFVVRENNGVITVYSLNEDEEESVYEITDINTRYLPDADKEKIQNGLVVYGKNELNALLEDFE